jgi:hypothetical protein
MTHPSLRCTRHGVPWELCADGRYRCQYCTRDRMLEQALSSSDAIVDLPPQEEPQT